MESAHTHVRENIKTAMVRQKKYHDQKLSWQKFVPGCQVYVFFPIRKAGRSPKFTSYWRGPYKVLSKMTDLTYKVDCGRSGKPQVIHVDRMRRRYPQTLQGETPDDERTAPEDEPEPLGEEVEEAHELSNHSDADDIPVRRRRKPQWMEDYVLY